MKDMPKISAAEWEVMKLLWKESPLTSEKIINSLTEKMDWSTQTVKTFITRLLKKEAIGFEKVGRAYNYYPLISEDECVKAENQSFLQKVYDGAVGMLFTRFLEEETLSEEEIEELEQILKDKKEGK
ncbi:BlaI/MecI/CopY family transcriptional regulator [Clostridium botulinum]|uniref:Penicillinase repressor n=1 Tax=Clostridium botulinum (strain Okra / Type B1) TaxID=498213 RepID=B1IDT5_CLOBK|nr:BlaI/MecI/CopY family transcriptional regulator [Clostridium botulinum]ACA44776.1 penicillinase repressor [Clostridium botulinum B1 str. Okra]MBD5563825.1 BlaI/MecI/CopY family transcriptional regulator [Clostridium botulinum]MBD5565215.1 BlaI/MecI/CopY family transcriptional regulator [Clostridium botulinum]MBD5570782.1 BlaI/MecI/CopY family transcriptional regulator [Clostridium botulinum]MBD5574698.1 BlaI/MecI/CopY family transcriptional regulator [Clostridium botulinum]